MVLDIDPGIATPRCLVDTVASTCQPSWPEIVIADLAQVGKANLCGMMPHSLKDRSDRGHVEIVSIVVPTVKCSPHAVSVGYAVTGDVRRRASASSTSGRGVASAVLARHSVRDTESSRALLDTGFRRDFLPPPSDLAFREQGVKVTIALSKKSVDFFKSEAAKHHTQYQRMIRRLVDVYVDSYAKPLTPRLTRTPRKRAAD